MKKNSLLLETGYAFVETLRLIIRQPMPKSCMRFSTRFSAFALWHQSDIPTVGGHILSLSVIPRAALQWWGNGVRYPASSVSSYYAETARPPASPSGRLGTEIPPSAVMAAAGSPSAPRQPPSSPRRLSDNALRS